MSIAPESIQETLGHEFGDLSLLERALTHSSFGHARSCEDNERLEFLGDAVLQLAVTLELLARYPTRPEGELSQIRARLVNRATLHELALQLGLSDHLRLDTGARRQGAAHNERTLADAVEAILGAVFRDAGFEVARSIVCRLWITPRLEAAAAAVDEDRIDPVTTLQEDLQGKHGRTPRYEDLGIEGEPPIFVVAVALDGKRLGTGRGRSKRAARRAAAREALSLLTVSD